MKAAFTVLDSFPALVRAFVRRARAVGIECREGFRSDEHGRALLSLHGTDSQFRQLPEMAKHRLPLRTGHWWLRLGIVGTLYREGEGLVAVIEWTREPGSRGKYIRDGAKLAEADVAFQQFMRKVLEGRCVERTRGASHG